MPRKNELSDDPIAVTSDGGVYANATHLGIDVAKLLPHVPGVGRVFVGVRLSRGEVKKLLAVADDALAEGVAKIASRRSQRSKKK
ncbi:hypothetical protein [Polyangium aurulentum]|uniref:hypothetical protein n=1 Tax=Polyangium aurulentum TaxID=2567896 RepID=UPI0010ADF111|nr:hypothetical protein [Polyangium aurulentum]UQA61404.1 hypothetical protein E8A73_013390 [Polyangium aurulentum]